MKKMRLISVVLCICMLFSVSALASADPTGSAAPTDTTTVEPTNEPTGPNAPTDPNVPTSPDTPTGPNTPTGPDTPTGPNTPTGPVVPPQPGEPTIPTAPAGKLPFTDVADDSWYYDAIYYCYTNGLMIGTSDTAFEPDMKLTRAMMVTIIYRLDGSNKVNSVCAFEDVDQNTWYSDAVNWASANKVTLGTSATTFEPNAPITREMMMTMLYRYFQLKGNTSAAGDTLSKFVDADQVSDWAVEGASWCVDVGLIIGVGDKEIDPAGTATRAEAATIIARADILFS